MKDRVIIASSLLSPLAKTTNPERTSQRKQVKDLDSNRAKDLLINRTIPVTIYNNLLNLVIQIKSSNYREIF